MTYTDTQYSIST